MYGLLCNRDGCPVAVQAFAGNTSDPDTIADQVTALRERFGLARVTGDDFPGERLLVCFNPMVAAERRRQRDLLLELTEAEAARLAAGYAADYDRDEFNRRLGMLRRRRRGKHLRWEFDEATGAFISTRKQESIREEASLDGIYVIRTSLEREALGDEETPEHGVPMLSAMTPLQEQAFELLGISPHPAPALGAGSARTPQPSQ